MHTESERLLEKILREKRHNVTAPRLAVFRALYGSEPLFMRQLLAKVGASIDRVSVYRTVALYEELGLIHRITIGWKYKLELSEIFQAHHHHICCLRCGKLQAIKENTALEQTIQAMADEAGFSLETHQLELQGYCKDCQKAL
ncbi:MAG TPA: transcriptional repressor [Verrucomicrobiae bacterium]|nr:transcriptional repressor [Verrucomicrobiae bacterium]